VKRETTDVCAGYSAGRFRFGEGLPRITTVLGSCVSIILWHPQLIHGGMCHYMPPSRKRARGFGADGKWATKPWSCS
jgi:chemotaxis protein CheD